MDVYWITVGGQDPVAYLKKYPGRFKVLHIKDEYVIGESGQPGQQAGAPGGVGQRDPQVQAGMLKESLEDIRLSAEYLNKSKFVK